METTVSSNISVYPGINSPVWTGRAGAGAPRDTQPEGATEDAQTQTHDRLDLSPEAQEAARSKTTPSKEKSSPVVSSDNEADLSPDQLQQLRDLQARDREVRTHEQAHLSAAGQYAAGSASFTFQLGPDGSRYAVGGEVPIDISKAATPEETIQKMETIRTAALAPAEPSAADRQIAAQAAMTAAQARQEVLMAAQEQQAVTGSADDAEQDSKTEPENYTAEPSVPQPSVGGVTVSTMINAYAAMQTLG